MRAFSSTCERLRRSLASSSKIIVTTDKPNNETDRKWLRCATPFGELHFEQDRDLLLHFLGSAGRATA